MSAYEPNQYYTETCKECGEPYWTEQGSPEPNLCNQCMRRGYRALKETKTELLQLLFDCRAADFDCCEDTREALSNALTKYTEKEVDGAQAKQ